MSRSWKLLHAKIIQSCRIFSIKSERYRSPRSGKEHDFYLIDSVDWVNIIPLTSDEKVILVKQFRFGTKDFSLEIPGGMLDDGEPPAQAARRELLEETGYAGDEPILLGMVHPNPAIHTNRCYSYLIRNVTFSNPPQQDSTEDIEVQIVPLAEIPRLIRDGRITHALVIAAFYWYFINTGVKGSRVHTLE
ncbi:MAG: NUDIX hydrolase, partial [Deltaproteobacteria bacterium]|nr:NUDIX hydrolase [Deltaproteobacteria bacterium]